MDSGNLVLQEGSQQGEILWESFKSPTDTFLPNMTMDANLTLTSWREKDEPGTGDFTFKLDADAGETQFITTNKSNVHWKSAGEFATSNKMRDAIVTIVSFANKTQTSNQKSDFGLSPPDIFDTMLVLKFDGNITYQKWDKYKKAWILIWLEPRDRCSSFNFCGNFGLCSSKNGLACQCLQGFRPRYQGKWDSGEFSGGCIRETELCSKREMFLSMKMRNIGNPDGPPYPANNETECRKECLGLCQCQAYLFQAAKNSMNRGDSDSSTSSCSIWSRELNDLQEDDVDDSHNLSVRIALSESTVRNCYPCGKTSVPYPLSTGRDCGDPMYFSFQCSKSMDNLTFKAPSGEYQVISIDPHNRKFVIQVKDFDVCNARNIRGNLQLNKSSPFNVTNWCYTKNLPQRRGEIELVWDIPPEPTCTLQESCNDWPDSTCSIASDGKKRCRCNTNYMWNGVNLNCSSKQERRRSDQRSKDLLKLDTQRHIKHLINSGGFEQEDEEGIDVPFFNFESIVAATDDFSDANKLGQGGYGPVYKGILSGGQEIAVKRLSSVSGQGLQEFKNEVVLIAKLQHRNLVRLRGYCIKGEEKILLYEYMPNKSLDSFIFDDTQSMLLDWEMRFNIILGIARGLLYLHQDSRLRIIHRDLKTSNILLDRDMEPKISDFGLARIVNGKQTEANTNRVVGTYGYMSPEYALEGLFSIKSDVFSFGVVLLEIISGRKNTRLVQYEQSPLSLLGYAWRLWTESKVVDLIDPSLQGSYKEDQYVKCFKVGLLCVQEDPSERPTMSSIIAMLDSETATIPTPQQPAFVLRRGSTVASSSSSKPETIAEITTTLEEGR
ncbi:hypothetical protein TIFTF001_017195 [Ficus carica]|uniref:Receptor-like serine/threonine-protein kinase n=1 Tax=Ficus carica TaxID=3494 RepID=A0AA88DAI1_FICCA|nr:hypothetical protein TIFTF001_017195 [Ficus carica]